MLEIVATEKLRIGMYVVLPLGWSEHPFITNKFRIKSQEQIKEIAKCGLSEVPVDLGKSELPAHAERQPDDYEHQDPLLKELNHTPHGTAQDDPRMSSPSELPKWDPESLIPQELSQALADNNMSPEHRSQAVYRHSREMMDRLLESPTAENIRASKKAIGKITDLILSDDRTACSLLKITSHDFYTYTHSVNVGVTAIMLAKELYKKSDAHNLQELGAGFFLHDLGKVKVDSKIINKPGRLTDDEMRRMRTHPYQGYKLLKQADTLSEECRYIVMQHHEFSDGTGYPKRLKNDEIHPYGKICGIADVFDALTAERSYKKALTPFEALRLMQEQMAHHFDKKMFESFVLLLSQ